MAAGNIDAAITGMNGALGMVATLMGSSKGLSRQTRGRHADHIGCGSDTRQDSSLGLTIVAVHRHGCDEESKAVALLPLATDH